jgi:hypothetical protein
MLVLVDEPGLKLACKNTLLEPLNERPVTSPVFHVVTPEVLTPGKRIVPVPNANVLVLVFVDEKYVVVKV